MTTNEENAGIPATTVAFLCEVFSTGIRRNWFPKLVDEGRGDRSYSSSSSLIVDPTITSISDNVIFAQDHLLECLQQLNDPAVVFLLENAHHFESVYNSCRNSYVRDRVAKLIFTQVLMVHRAEMYRQRGELIF